MMQRRGHASRSALAPAAGLGMGLALSIGAVAQQAQDGRRGEAPNVFASPVAGDGRVSILGQDGGTAVIRHGPTYEVLATNRLDDRFDASPALVDNELYLRGYRYLYCLAAQ